MGPMPSTTGRSPPAAGRIVQHGEHGDRGDHGRANAAGLDRHRVCGAVDEQVADHVSTHLVEGAVFALAAGDGLADRGDPAEDRMQLHHRREHVQGAHPIAPGLEHHPPGLHRRRVPLFQRRGPHRLDQPVQGAAERADRLRLREHQSPRRRVRTQRRVELVDRIGEQHGMPFGDPATREGVQHQRVAVHHRLGMPDHPPCDVLGDPHRRRQLQPDRPLHDLRDPRTPTRRFNQQLPPHRIDPGEPLRCEHPLHHGRLHHQIHDIRHGQPRQLLPRQAAELHCVERCLRIVHEPRVEHSYDTDGDV